LSADKAFMGTNSLSIANGATTPDIEQAETKKAMIAAANKVIILADSDKIGKHSFAQFVEIDEIDTIITESIQKKDYEKFTDKGIEVITPKDGINL